GRSRRRLGRGRPQGSRSRRRSRRRRRRHERSADLHVYTADVKVTARTAGAGFLAACALLGFGASFALASKAGATAAPQQTTEPPTTTTTTAPPPTEPPVQPPPSGPAPIAFGVTVGGVRVGGMLPYQARKAVEKVYVGPLQLVADEAHTLPVGPAGLGAKANFDKAVRRARFARPGAIVPLDV